MDLNFLINRLPLEIREYIIQLTYKPQPVELLHDITNFYKTKQKIYKESSEETMPWIIDHILLNMNSNLPTILGYSEKMENILLRNNLITCSEDIDLYLFVLLKKPVNTQLNILLGLLNPFERNNLI